MCRWPRSSSSPPRWSANPVDLVIGGPGRRAVPFSDRTLRTTMSMKAPLVVARAAVRGRWFAAVAALLATTLLAAPPARAQAAVRELPDFTELVERVGPAVVNIRTAERRGGNEASSGGGEIDEQMREFFRRFGIPLPDRMPPPGQPRRGGPQQP